MNDTLILSLVIIGGATGLAIVGVAIWMMRQENTVKQQENSAEQNTVESSLSTGVESSMSTGVQLNAPTTEADPLEEPPLNPTPTLVPPPDPVTSPTRPPLPNATSTDVKLNAPTPGWFNALTSRLSSTNPPGASSDLPPAQEVLRVLHSAEGNLVLEVNGQRYQTRADLNNERLEQQIANAISDLNDFLNGPATEPIKATTPLEAPLPILPPPAKPQPSTPSRKEPAPDNRPVIKVSLQEAKQMEVKPPSMDIMQQWRYIRDQKLKPVVQIKSVMDEINDILQVMIIGHPLAGRGLKAADGLQGAVFTLDGINYDSVEALPEAEAREMLRAAIQKWDQK